MANNIVRAHIEIRGKRPLLQHSFGEDAMPLQKGERSGVAGNDPEEWKRTRLITKDGQLYMKAAAAFGMIREAAKYTRKGKSSLQSLVAATLLIEDSIILLDRYMPKGEISRDPTESVYLDVCGVRNPSTKARNVRYRLACSPGWTAKFKIAWDKTIVSREQMKAILNDAGMLVGFSDGRSVGNGRFDVIAFEMIEDAKEAAAA
jgi:hypothetical protein